MAGVARRRRRAGTARCRALCGGRRHRQLEPHDAISARAAATTWNRAASGWVKACPNDASEHFPRTDPAIIVAITDKDDRLLLGANAQWGGKRFSTLAGFVEPGESLESAVIREVAEESGVAVANPRYMGSQPWPFPCSLMLGFTATALGTELRPDGVEIIDLRWFTREELAAQIRSGEIGVPVGVSIASALIEDWYGGALPEPEHLEN